MLLLNRALEALRESLLRTLTIVVELGAGAEAVAVAIILTRVEMVEAILTHRPPAGVVALTHMQVGGIREEGRQASRTLQRPHLGLVAMMDMAEATIIQGEAVEEVRACRAIHDGKDKEWRITMGD